MSELAVGKRVRIIRELSSGTSYTGRIYDHVQSLPFPWCVRPDNYPKDEAGIAFYASELEVIEDQEATA